MTRPTIFYFLSLLVLPLRSLGCDIINGEDLACTSNCTSTAFGCDIPNCESDCTCVEGGCDMSKCTDGCISYASGINMKSCITDCECSAGNCDMSRCEEECNCGTHWNCGPKGSGFATGSIIGVAASAAGVGVGYLLYQGFKKDPDEKQDEGEEGGEEEDEAEEGEDKAEESEDKDEESEDKDEEEDEGNEENKPIFPVSSEILNEEQDEEESLVTAQSHFVSLPAVAPSRSHGESPSTGPASSWETRRMLR